MRDVKAVTRMAGLANVLIGIAPMRIKYTRSRAGEVVSQGYYEPGSDGRWRPVSPPVEEIN